MVFLSGSLDGTYGVSEIGEMDLLMSCLAASRLASSSFLQVPCSVLEVSTVVLFDAMMKLSGFDSGRLQAILNLETMLIRRG